MTRDPKGNPIALIVDSAGKVQQRMLTLDRAMWGTDQAASVEPAGMMRLIRDVRVIEKAMGDGVKKVYDSEVPILKKLRRT